jgi:hypothetical protein
MTKRVYVYGLSSTEDGVIRYIGQTIQKPYKRLINHRNLRARYAHTSLSKWVSASHAGGHRIIMSILDHDAVWSDTERDTIAAYTADGFDLVNSTEGGDGRPGFVMPLDVRMKVSAGNKGKPKSAAHRAALSAAHLGKKLSPSHAAGMSACRKGITPKNYEAMLAKRRANAKPKPIKVPYVVSEETKRRISESNRGRKHILTDDQIARRGEHARKFLHTPEVALKRRASQRVGYILSPETIAKRQANRVYRPWTIEERAARSLKQAEIWRIRKEASFVE